MKTLFGLVVALCAAIVGMLAVASSASAQAPTCTQYRTVQSGESYWSIADALGMDYNRLAAMNGSKTLHPGTKICVSIVSKKPVTGRVVFRIPAYPAKEYWVTIRASNGQTYGNVHVYRWFWPWQKVTLTLNGANRVIDVR